MRPDFKSPPWELILKQQFLAILLFSILAYTLGLLLSSVNQMMQVRYYRLDLREAGGIFRQAWRRTIRFLYYFPSPRMTPQLVDANLRIAEDLERLAGLRGLSSQASPWDRLVIYRTLKADRIGESHKFALSEADACHRRFGFSMGVSLTIFLLSFQFLLRLVVYSFGIFCEPVQNWYGTLPVIPLLVLALFAFLGFWASFELRQVAIRTWEIERYLTASLASY